jgi:hypothetical protein
MRRSLVFSALLSRGSGSNIQRGMSSITRMILLGAALAPYVALVGIDAWMHERARRVPRLEQVLHYLAAALFLAFVVTVFRGADRIALPLFAIFVAVTAGDAIGFHRHLAPLERRVHLASYVALAFFFGAWRFVGAAG